MNYYVIMTVRNNEESIGKCLTSILEQTIKPDKILIVDDGSKDNTSNIINQLKAVSKIPIEYVYQDNPEPDYSRIPINWNKCLLPKKDYDYHLIMAGDIILRNDYVELLLKDIKNNEKIVISSGVIYNQEKISMPRGAGRLVKQDFFYNIYHSGYPVIIGYETEILFYALQNGFINNVNNNAMMHHTDKLGHGHKFIEFGYAMKSLGYSPEYVLARTIVLAFNKTVGLLNALRILRAYLSNFPKNNPSYFRYHNRELIQYIGRITSFNSKYSKARLHRKVLI